jgi:hypothetical protein
MMLNPFNGIERWYDRNVTPELRAESIQWN